MAAKPAKTKTTKPKAKAKPKAAKQMTASATASTELVETKAVTPARKKSTPNRRRIGEVAAAREVYARSLYLTLGLQRSLKKVARLLANEDLLRDAYPGSTIETFHRNLRNEKLMSDLRATKQAKYDQLVERYLDRCEVWSAKNDWVGRAEAYETERAQEAIGLLREKTAEKLTPVAETTAQSFYEQIEEGRAVRIKAGAKLLQKIDQDDLHGAPALVQALGMGTQMERSARQFFLGGIGAGAAGSRFGQPGGLEVPTLAALMQSLGDPGAGGSGGAGPTSEPSPGGAHTVHISQVNVQQNTTMLTGPLTVEALRQLHAAVPADLEDWRQQRGLPSRSSTEEPWVEVARKTMPQSAGALPAPKGLPTVVDADPPTAA